MNNTVLTINATSIAHSLPDEGSTEDLLREAFRLSFKEAFMASNDDDQFKAAIVAVLMKLGTDHPDHERLSKEAKMLARVSTAMAAAAQGVTVDLGSVLDGMDFEPYGISGMWHEAKEENEARWSRP